MFLDTRRGVSRGKYTLIMYCFYVLLLCRFKINRTPIFMMFCNSRARLKLYEKVVLRICTQTRARSRVWVRIRKKSYFCSLTRAAVGGGEKRPPWRVLLIA